MTKIEAFDDSHFMHQTARVCHTDHPDSIVCLMECIVDLKNKSGKSHCYRLGMAKIEAFDNSYFMHQTVRIIYNVSGYSSILTA